MKINQMIFKNDVEAENQTKEKFKVKEITNSKKRVLFLGNSITLHETAPNIGWHWNWGMAASSAEKDYVHLVLKALHEKYGDISYCIANVGEWEKNYHKEGILEKFKGAQAFKPDIVIFRFGENVNPESLKQYPFMDYLRNFVEYFTTTAKQIIITDTFWEHEYICDAMRQVAEENGYTFVSIADLGYQDENKALGLFEHAGVAAHPGDLGMQRIAEKIIMKL